MLPPHELKNANFSRAMRGYNPVEVDEYVEFLIGKYTELYRENDELDRKLKSTVTKLEEIRSEEDSIRSALIEAKRTAAQIKADAEAQAELIIRSAKTSCNSILANFNEKIAEGHDTLVALKSDISILKQELFLRYSEHIESIKGLTDGIDMSDVPATDELRREAVNALKASLAAAYAAPAAESAAAEPEQAAEPAAEDESDSDESDSAESESTDSDSADELEELTDAEDVKIAFAPAAPAEDETRIFGTIGTDTPSAPKASFTEPAPEAQNTLTVERTQLSKPGKSSLKSSVLELNRQYKSDEDVINTPDSDVGEDSNYLDFVMSVTGKDKQVDPKRDAEFDMLFSDQKSGKKKK